MIEYRDFWVRIERRDDAFWVSVRTPAGEDQGPLRLDASAEGYDLAALLHPSASRRSDPTARDIEAVDVAPEPEHVGAALFDALFSGPIRDALNTSRGMVGARGGLRIRLQIDLGDPELARLAQLPWELLYDEGQRVYLGRSPYTPVVRYLEVPVANEPPPFEPPLRVLIVLANPAGTHPLDLAKERASIEASWARLEGVEVTILENATRAAVFEALDAGGYHVLHYMGHGGFDERTGHGVLLLEDDAGQAAPLLGTTLGDTLRDARSVRLAVLNACDTGKAGGRDGLDPFSGVASSLVLAGLPAVVAMQLPVADVAAIAFAETFYERLVQHAPVDAAAASGRKAIHRAAPTTLEWATPVLFMRAPDGRLFEPAAPPAPERLPASEPAAASPSAAATAQGAPDSDGALAPQPPGPPQPRGTSGGLGWKIAVAAAALALVAALIAWLSFKPDPLPVPSPDDVATVRLMEPQVSLAVGAELPLRATLLDDERRPLALVDDAGEPLGASALEWVSTDSAIARVEEGRITGVSPGRAVVYARFGALQDSVLVSVLAR